jgi:hypothetical protein
VTIRQWWERRRDTEKWATGLSAEEFNKHLEAWTYIMRRQGKYQVRIEYTKTLAEDHFIEARVTFREFPASGELTRKVVCS